MFDKILKHLNRKRPKITESSKGIPVKPICVIKDNILDVEYNYYYMQISYSPDKINHYKIYIEYNLAVFGRARQEIGTHWWEDEWHEQEDVIEYIRYKLR